MGRMGLALKALFVYAMFYMIPQFQQGRPHTCISEANVMAGPLH